MGKVDDGRMFLGRVVSQFGAFRQRRREADMVAHLDEGGRARLAADIGVGTSDLAGLIGNDGTANELLGRTLAAYGLDADEIALRERAVLREIQSVCSRCEAKRRCQRELDAGTARAHASQFCPNALTMAGLAHQFGRRASPERL